MRTKSLVGLFWLLQILPPGQTADVNPIDLYSWRVIESAGSSAVISGDGFKIFNENIAKGETFSVSEKNIIGQGTSRSSADTGFLFDDESSRLGWNAQLLLVGPPGALTIEASSSANALWSAEVGGLLSGDGLATGFHQTILNVGGVEIIRDAAEYSYSELRGVPTPGSDNSESSSLNPAPSTFSIGSGEVLSISGNVNSGATVGVLPFGSAEAKVQNHMSYEIEPSSARLFDPELSGIFRLYGGEEIIRRGLTYEEAANPPYPPGKQLLYDVNGNALGEFPAAQQIPIYDEFGGLVTDFRTAGQFIQFEVGESFLPTFVGDFRDDYGFADDVIYRNNISEGGYRLSIAEGIPFPMEVGNLPVPTQMISLGPTPGNFGPTTYFSLVSVELSSRSENRLLVSGKGYLDVNGVESSPADWQLSVFPDSAGNRHVIFQAATSDQTSVPDSTNSLGLLAVSLLCLVGIKRASA